MKVLSLTPSMAPEKGGWGRYSQDLVDGLEANKIEVITVSLPYLPGPLSWKKNYFLFFYYAFKIFINKRYRDVDLIHAHVETYAPIAFLLSCFLRKPYGITLHGTYSVKPFSKNIIVALLQTLSYRKADGLFAVSNYTKNRVLDFVPQLKIDVIPNGVKLASTYERVPEEVILTVAPLKERKGIAYLATALPEIFDKTTVKWIHVGSEDDPTYMNRVFSTLDNYKDRYVHYSYVTEEELKKLYQKAKIFALTPASSKFDFEGFGLVYLEANSYGVPVIGTTGSGVEEAIVNGENGFLVSLEDKGELVKRILELLQNQNIYEEVSRKSKVWAEKHSIDNIAKRYITSYSELVQNR